MSEPNDLPRIANRVALFVCAVALTAPIAGAQETQRRTAERPRSIAPSPSPAPSPAATSPTADAPDLSITANVTARELLFEVVPNPKVEFTGQPRRDTVWEAERTNLPPAVQPGVTYRDIGIRLKITSVFADIERIVAEALGEISASDDAPRTTGANVQTPGDNALAGAAQVEAAPASITSTRASRAPVRARNARGRARPQQQQQRRMR